MLVNIYDHIGSVGGDDIKVNTTFNYDTNNELISYTEQYEDSESARRYDVSYNSDDLVLKTYRETANSEPIFEEEDIIPYENGNRMQEGNNNTTYYSYDNSNGIFKNIHAIEVFRALPQMLIGETHVFTSENNVIYDSSYEDIPAGLEYEYTYNEDNYPTKLVYKFNGVIEETIEYFYE